MCAGPARWLGTTDTSMGMYGSPMRVRLRRDRPRVAAVLVAVLVVLACAAVLVRQWTSPPAVIAYRALSVDEEDLHVCVLPISSEPRAFYDKHVPAQDTWTGRLRSSARLPGVRTTTTASPFYMHSEWRHCPLAHSTRGAAPSFWDGCDATPECPPTKEPAQEAGGTPALATLAGAVPPTLNTGADTVFTLQRAMRAAWGAAPPRVDVVVRASCHDRAQLQVLFASLEVFWPADLGDIVVVLDEGDESAIESVRPANWATTRHSFRFLYERVPCIDGTVARQVSLANLDRHTDADFVVVVAPDTVFHTPVTPDVLFDNVGRAVKVVSSAAARQPSVSRATELFVAASSVRSVELLPFTIAPTTLTAFREWARTRRRGSCYFDDVLRFLESVARQELSGRPGGDGGAAPSAGVGLSVDEFCWRCQVDAFVGATNHSRSLYTFADIDAAPAPAHVPFALRVAGEGDAAFLDGRSPTQRAAVLVRGGICRALGADLVPACGKEHVDAANKLIDAAAFAQQDGSAKRVMQHVTMFRRVVAETMGSRRDADRGAR